MKPNVQWYTECPPKEELSAWHDGEGDDAVGSHVSACSACRVTTEFYGQVDRIVRVSLQPSSGLTERIAAACEALPPEPLRLQWPLVFLRAAAIIVIVTTLSAVFMVLQPVRNQSILAGGPNSGAKVLTPAVVEDVDLPPVRRALPSVFATVRPDGLSPFLRVAAGDPQRLRDRTVLSRLSAGGNTQTVLPNSVKHVWVVDDLQKGRQQLLSALPDGVSYLCASKENRAMRFRISLSDANLQALVDRLEQRGFALVSPEPPQPGQVDRLSITGKEIVYVADLVMR